MNPSSSGLFFARILFIFPLGRQRWHCTSALSLCKETTQSSWKYEKLHWNERDLASFWWLPLEWSWLNLGGDVCPGISPLIPNPSFFTSLEYRFSKYFLIILWILLISVVMFSFSSWLARGLSILSILKMSVLLILFINFHPRNYYFFLSTNFVLDCSC